MKFKVCKGTKFLGNDHDHEHDHDRYYYYYYDVLS